MFHRLSFILAVYWTSSVVLAQSCVDSITPTTDIKNYKISDTGIVTHHKIMWSRCALGQTWLKGTCSGKATLETWDEAIQLASKASLHSFKNWRLPTIHELSAITELSCQNPAIRLQLFPDTPSRSFWTSTEFINNTANAWQVFFGSGENHTAKKSTRAAVRLVRTIAVE